MDFNFIRALCDLRDDFTCKIWEGREPMSAREGILKKDWVWGLVNFIQALNQQQAETHHSHAGLMH